MRVVDVKLRQAVPDDLEFLYDLHRASLQAVVVATWGSWDEGRQRGFHTAWFDPARLAVVVCNGLDAGVLDVQRQDDGTVYLARLELLPEQQDLGIGTRLVRQVVEEARRGAATTVVLDVLEANTGARRLYERLGFVVVSTSPPKQQMQLVIHPS